MANLAIFQRLGKGCRPALKGDAITRCSHRSERSFTSFPFRVSDMTVASFPACFVRGKSGEILYFTHLSYTFPASFTHISSLKQAEHLMGSLFIEKTSLKINQNGSLYSLPRWGLRTHTADNSMVWAPAYHPLARFVLSRDHLDQTPTWTITLCKSVSKMDHLTWLATAGTCPPPLDHLD